jgi:adiponectin receptor
MLMLFYLFQFQSHQIFHVLVIAAAFVHYHGITEMAMHRMSVGDCAVPSQMMAF